MTIEVGQKVSGKVTGITNFGAFVELGEGKTGLVHISEISDSYVKDIHDVLKVGDTVTVKVMSDKDGKIGLSIRKAVDRPAGAAPEHRSSEHRNYSHAGGNTGSAPRHDSRPNNFARNNNHNTHNQKEGFDDLLSGFLKDSEDRLSDLKRNTEGKRGGRGGRRS